MAGVNEAPLAWSGMKRVGSVVSPKATLKVIFEAVFCLVHTVFWFFRLLSRAGLLVLRDFAAGIVGLRVWLNSKDGVVAICGLAIILLLVAFSLIDQVRLHEPQIAAASETGSAARPEKMPDPVLVELGNQRLRHSDIIEYAHQAGRLPLNQTLTVEEVFERGLVGEAVDQLLLARAAQRSEAVMADSGVLTKLNISRNRILSAAYLRQVISDHATEENAIGIYQSQREHISLGDDLHLRQIVVSNQSLAESLYKALGEGADFRQIARDFSIDAESAARDGDMGLLSYGEIPPAYTTAASSLGRNDYSAPFEASGGWVILRLEGRKPVKPPSYPTVKGEILEFLKLQAIEQNLEALRAEADIEFFRPGSALEEQEIANNQLRD